MYSTPTSRRRNNEVDPFNVSDIRSSLTSAARASGSSKRFSLSGLQQSLDSLESPLNHAYNDYEDVSQSNISVRDIDMTDISYSSDSFQVSTYPSTPYHNLHNHIGAPTIEDSIQDIEMPDLSMEKGSTPMNSNPNLLDFDPSIEAPPTANPLSILNPVGLKKIAQRYPHDYTPDLIDLGDDADSKRTESPVEAKGKEKEEEAHKSSASRFILSPTMAGAEMALGSHALHVSDKQEDESTKPPMDKAEESQPHGLSLPTPTPAWISAMTHSLRRQEDLAVSEQAESHKRERMILMPYVISSYLQLFSNVALAMLISYGLVRGYHILKHDVTAKLVQRRSDIIQEAHRCAREYVRNECRPDVRAPMLEDLCSQWEECMEKALQFTGYGAIPETDGFDDDLVVGQDLGISDIQKIAGLYHSREDSLSHFAYIPAVAETLADIANAFFEPVTIKTLVMFIVMVVGLVYLSNFTFGYLRAKAFYGPYQDPNPYYPSYYQSPQQQTQHTEQYPKEKIETLKLL